MNDDQKEKVAQWLKALPNLGKLCFRLIGDPRVPKRTKIILGIVAVYFVVPFDVVPDWLPGVGRIDDVILLVLTLDAIVNRIPREIVAEHWDGEPDVLDTIRSGLGTATAFVPSRVRRVFTAL